MILLCYNRLQIKCLTEHHLKTEEIKNTNLDQYILGASFCRKKYKCGGVCIYISKSIQFSAINPEKYHKENDLEVCALKLNVQTYNFIIICIYRSPTGDYTHFLTQLEIILNELHNISNKSILCGDFNIDYTIDSCRKHLLDSLLASFNLFSTVKFPTRISTHYSSQIDNIYVNGYKFDFSVYPFTNGLSDHDAQIITLTDISTPIPEKSFSLIRKVDNNTIRNFVYSLNENWENVFVEENVNIIYNNFVNTYLRILYASFPFVRLRNLQNSKPWLTKGTKISCLHKRRLYLTYRNSTNPNRKKHYKRYCQILSRVITAAKRLHYSRLISQSANKQKTTWNIIKTLTNNKKTSNITTPINIDYESPTNLIGIANAFNTYFTSIADNLLTRNFSETDTTTNDDPMSYLRHNFKYCHSQIKLKNTTTYEINKIINSLKSKTSHGYDEISDKILKASTPFILSPLTYIFNKVLSSGTFPDRLKYSEVQPLFKKGEKTEISNYRPISLLPSLSKIIEKIIYKRLNCYLLGNNILANEQFGFREKSTADMATHALVNDIQLFLDKKRLVGGIFCDL